MTAAEKTTASITIEWDEPVPITHIGYQNQVGVDVPSISSFIVTFSDGSEQFCEVDQSALDTLQYYDIEDVVTSSIKIDAFSVVAAPWGYVGAAEIQAYASTVAGTTVEPCDLGVNLVETGSISDYSSEWPYSWVEYAIDGDPGTMWATAGEKTTAYITIEWPEPIAITHIGYQNNWPFALGAPVICSFTVTFSDGSEEFCAFDMSAIDDLQYFDIGDVVTSSIRIDAFSVIAPWGYVGAAEIEAYYSSDLVPPTITAPADVTVDTDSGVCTASGVDLGDATADDNCSVASVENDAFEPYALGDTTVTWTVTDGSGNTASATQTVTVEDNEAPTITAPADVSVSTDDGVCSATGVDLGAATADDNCSVASVENDAFEPYALGDTTVTWTVTDGSGNTASDTQTVEVVDTTEVTADDVTFSVSPDTLWPPNHQMVEITPTIEVDDNCTTVDSVTYYVATWPDLLTGGSNQDVNGKGDGNTDVDWNVNGNYVEVRAERAGGRSPGNANFRDRIYNITAVFSLTDGSSWVGQATVTVPHDQRDAE